MFLPDLFVVIGKTSVIITVSICCWPGIHDILLGYTSMKKHFTSDWGDRQVPSIRVIAHEL
jgi:hypothetical protein